MSPDLAQTENTRSDEKDEEGGRCRFSALKYALFFRKLTEFVTTKAQPAFGYFEEEDSTGPVVEAEIAEYQKSISPLSENVGAILFFAKQIGHDPSIATTKSKIKTHHRKKCKVDFYRPPSIYLENPHPR